MQKGETDRKEYDCPPYVQYDGLTHAPLLTIHAANVTVLKEGDGRGREPSPQA
jgi:hypothetical protein